MFTRDRNRFIYDGHKYTNRLRVNINIKVVVKGFKNLLRDL